MEIYYDPLKGTWGHRKAGKTFVWGKRQAVLPRRPFSPSLGFTVKARGKRIGPIVGILTTPGGATFAGNRKTFRHIHRALQRFGGILFVFTPQTTKHGQVKGFVFHDEKHRWVRATLPYPDVIYNRIPFREDEDEETVQAFLKRLQSSKTPYFNSGFLDKWEMYNCLRGDPKLQEHLPGTRQMTKAELERTLYTWGALYLKPQSGQKGDGMSSLILMADGSITHRSHKNLEHFPSFEKMWEALEPLLEKMPYLIQQRIHLTQLGGRPYDFRLMVQKVSGKWEVTGVGVRLAGENAITTHVPKGGELLSLDELDWPADIERLETIAKLAAERLESQFSPLHELSFDIGRDRNGRYWLFEANAKPMEFDEPAIETKRMQRLVGIFYKESGFAKSTPEK